MSSWEGSISLPDQRCLRGISLSTKSTNEATIGKESTLRFLSVVETARIPLCLINGTTFNVTTSYEDTEQWFSSIFLSFHAPADQDTWWQSARTDSPIGILAAVDDGADVATTKLGGRPKVTEVLFFATKDASSIDGRPPTPPQSSPTSGDEPTPTSSPEVRLLALPLCSELLSIGASEVTPPPSPKASDEHVEARFLDNEVHQPSETAPVVNVVPVRKRKSVNDTFDEATERRRKATRKGGQAVSAAAALPIKPEDSIPTLQHRRSTSNTQIPLQSRPLSRASSVASSTRPVTAREPSIKPSSLSQIHSAETTSQSPQQLSTEKKNKELVGKMVMAGMRLLGLNRKQPRKSRSNSTAASPAAEAGFEDVEADRKNEDEYMLIYYQAYKGTCCAFRQYMSTTSLQGQEMSLRDTVDRLLAIFCNDPMTIDIKVAEDEYIPGGRKIFGSSALPASEYANPFLQAAMTGRESQANTPCFRKPKGKEKAVM